MKHAITDRWGTVPLIDMLKETALRTGMLASLAPAGGRGNLPDEVLSERLLLCLYAYGTNSGLHTVAAATMAIPRPSCATSPAATSPPRG